MSWVDDLKVGDQVFITRHRTAPEIGTVTGLRKLHIQVNGDLLFRRAGLGCVADDAQRGAWGNRRSLAPFDQRVLDVLTEHRRRNDAIWRIRAAATTPEESLGHLTAEQLEAIADQLTTTAKDPR